MAGGLQTGPEARRHRDARRLQDERARHGQAEGAVAEVRRARSAGWYFLLALWERVARRVAARRVRGLSPRVNLLRQNLQRQPVIRRFAPPSSTRGEGKKTPTRVSARSPLIPPSGCRRG